MQEEQLKSSEAIVANITLQLTKVVVTHCTSD